MSASAVFVNIDWKARRMGRTLKRNMQILEQTIKGVVRVMKPTMMCMREVGETKHPLNQEQMEQIATESMQAWKDVATEHVRLRRMFTTGYPYMTVYIDGPIKCSPNSACTKGSPFALRELGSWYVGLSAGARLIGPTWLCNVL